MVRHVTDEAARLPPLLLLLTFVSGLVDATSYLRLGHVFVANMTGNLVFIGFALAGAKGFSVVYSVVGIAAFAAGALATGRLGRSMQASRAFLLRITTAVELGIVVLAAVLSLLAISAAAVIQFVVVALLAGAMGIQSATTTRLQVPGFNSTVVLTTMLSTLAQESRLAGGAGAQNGWRILAIGAMVTGGLIGALMVTRMALVAPLDLAVLILTTVCLSAHVIARSAAD
jgi:uncharacterized membrane protein YoaK (UPF0700 family)